MRKFKPIHLVTGWVLGAVLTASSIARGGIFLAQGELAAEATTHSVLLQSRLTAIAGPELAEDGDIPGAAGVAAFQWSESPALEDSHQTEWLEAQAERDFIVRAALRDLKPGTVYYYRLVYGPTKA